MPDAPPPTPPARGGPWSPGADLEATFPASDSKQRKPPTSRRNDDDASAVCNLDMENIGDAPQDASLGHMADADAAAPGDPSCDAGSAETPRGAGRPAEPSQPATSRKRSGSNGPQRGPPDAAKKQKPDGRDAKRDLESKAGPASEPKRRRQEDAEGD